MERTEFDENHSKTVPFVVILIQKLIISLLNLYVYTWEPTTFIFRVITHMLGVENPSFFMFLGSKGIYIYIYTHTLS